MEDTPLTQLLAVATTILGQALELVENILVSDDQLTVQSKYLPGSAIGKHLRHARDHFLLLVDSVSSPAPHELSYDVRVRNTPMEANLTDARDALKVMITRLEEVVPTVTMTTPITLHAITPHMQTMQTTFGRELWFSSLHAVHHWSMVRVIAGEMNIKLHVDFGFAPSTLVYHSSRELKAKAKM
ncbi:hypothetical protein FIBSPDRAFT_848592 [Athelia psychrophila]|uniref:DinB-like domain-containing protein n=1 Tax=Athelia psychrophila TaxID=1759441 RepID=A0A166V0J4_9AGAM|nr:hypothetical protein FIBSPDRAFT_848592 [Fibularhizoctonia sp. CBS 109695]